MTKRASILLLAALSLTSAAIAQPYYRPPPVVVYAPPPPAYALGGVSQYPQAAIVPDGMGGWVPATNSTYDPGAGQFIPPEPPQQPQWGEPARPPGDPRGCYDRTGNFVGGNSPEC